VHAVVTRRTLREVFSEALERLLASGNTLEARRYPIVRRGMGDSLSAEEVSRLAKQLELEDDLRRAGR